MGLWSDTWQKVTPWDESKGQTFFGIGKKNTPTTTSKTITGAKQKGYTIDELKAMGQQQQQQQKSEKKSIVSRFWQSATPWDEDKGETVSAKGASIMAAELLVPGVYTARHWNDMSGGEKAFSIAMDAMALLPMVTAASRGARAITVAGRGARLSGAAKGVGKEAIAQIRAPIDMVLHPVSTGKGVVKNTRSLAEDIAHPWKIPEAVITTSETTAKIRIDKNMTAEKAMVIRDELMRLSAKGEKPVVELGGYKVELSQSPLMKELKGGVVHNSSTGEQFLKGLEVVQNKAPSGKLRPLKEQGLFVAHDPLPRFATSTAHGIAGENPTMVIFSKELAEKAIPTGKIYNSKVVGQVAEVEMKFPVGTKLPAPKQKLFTRIGPLQQKVEIYLHEPLSKKQIAKLKGIAAVENLKTPFKPSLKIKGTGSVEALTENEVEQMVKLLAETGNVDQADSLIRANNIVRTERKLPKQLHKITGDVDIDKVETERKQLSIDDTPREETPRVDTPREETPRVDTPREETPRVDTPREETPRVDDERPDDKRPDDKRPDDERPDDKRPDDERPDDKRPDDKRPDETPPEQPRPSVRVKDTEEAKAGRIKEKDKKITAVLPSGTTKKSTRKTFPDGTVAHKQGIGYWSYFPPYGEDDREFTIEKPLGAIITKDAKSAFETIQAIGGNATINKTYDMGIMDVHIGEPPRDPSASKGRKAIKFTKDTKGTYGRLKKNQKPTTAGKTTKTRSKKVGPYYVGSGGSISRKPLD